MTFHWPTELRKEAEHLVNMASTPGWEEHAKHRRDERLASPTWSGLREEIVRVQRERRQQETSSAPPAPPSSAPS